MENVEELSVSTTTDIATDNVVPSCANCGSPQLATHSKTPLCQTCRDQFIKFPVPLWIKAFGGVLLITLLFCLISLPKNIQTGIDYNKGLKASEQHKYFTAAKAFRNVLEKEPNYLDAQCHLLIASFYNGDIATVANMYALLENKEVEDTKLFNEVSQVLKKASQSLPSDSFNQFVELSGLEADSISPTAYYSYLAAHPVDDFAKLRLASILHDQQAYAAADSLLDQTLRFDPYYLAALTLKVPVKRDLGQFDSAMIYANRLLTINQEYTFAHGAIVKILLKQKKDKEALQMARQLYTTYGNDEYILGGLTLAYHFNNDLKQRDLILQQVAKDTAMATTATYLKDVISGKEKFRTN